MGRIQRYAAIGALIAASASAQNLPHPDHIVVVMMENKSFDDIIDSSNAPYLNTLRARGALLAASYGLHHPSQPNYIELFSGSQQGVCTDTCPQPINAPNLATSLQQAHRTFIGYAEHFSTACGPTPQQYAQKHCPWRDFTQVPATDTQDFSAFPQTPAQFPTLPHVAFVIPDLYDDRQQ